MKLKYGDRAARDLAAGLGSEGRCRAGATSIGAYTASNGTLTANANGALAAQDGVTMVVGDVLMLPEGLTNVTAADAGPYTIVSLGGASAKVVLARPSWWKHADLIPQGGDLLIGPEGTLFGATTWKSFVTTAIKVIGTDAPLFWPRRVTQQVVLVGGHLVKTNVPIRSATLTQFFFSRTTANTCSSTVQYVPLSIVAGALGTASVDVTAAVAAGTINAADVSTLAFTIENF